MVPERVMIGMGSNQGDRLANLQSAARAIAAHGMIDVLRIADVYESAAMVRPGAEPQDDYLNTVIEADVRIEPESLLDALLTIEASLGRIRSETRWEPRTIDLDIIVFGSRVVNTVRLTLPHPALGSRPFVLVPLADLAPEAILPLQSLPLRKLADRAGRDAVRRVGSIHLPSLHHDHS